MRGRLCYISLVIFSVSALTARAADRSFSCSVTSEGQARPIEIGLSLDPQGRMTKFDVTHTDADGRHYFRGEQYPDRAFSSPGAGIYVWDGHLIGRPWLAMRGYLTIQANFIGYNEILRDQKNGGAIAVDIDSSCVETTAAPAPPQIQASPIERAAQACGVIDDPTQRLACYDAAVQRIAPPTINQTVPAVDQSIAYQAVATAIGNADAKPAVTVDGSSVNVVFDLSPWSLTSGTTRTMFNDLASKIIPDIFFKFRNVQRITIEGTGKFNDIRGNESTEDAFRVTFSRENAGTVHWDKIDVGNLHLIADAAWAHPSLGW